MVPVLLSLGVWSMALALSWLGVLEAMADAYAEWARAHLVSEEG